MHWKIKQEISTRVSQKNIKNNKSSAKEQAQSTCYELQPMNNTFWKPKRYQQEFGYGLFTKLPRIVVIHDFVLS